LLVQSFRSACQLAVTFDISVWTEVYLFYTAIPATSVAKNSLNLCDGFVVTKAMASSHLRMNKNLKMVLNFASESVIWPTGIQLEYINIT